MTPTCTHVDCFETPEFDSIVGEGKLCPMHARIEADELVHLS
jgi:hypothetical protein